MASSTTATGHYGKGFTPEQETLVTIQKEGRCCQGTHSSDWHGLLIGGGKILPPSSFVFCTYCAENSMKGRVRKFTETELETYRKEDFDCSMSRDLSFVVRKVFSDKRKVSVNVNITDPTDPSVFAPAPILSGEKADAAAKVGAAIVPLPSGCYPEIGIRCYERRADYYYMVRARTGTGKELRFRDAQGREYYTHSSKPFYIDSFDKGNSSKRILYTTASQLEREAGIAPEHEDMSNKFYITVTIYHKQKIEMEEEETQWRTPPVMRGGSTMRSAPVMRGGSTMRSAPVMRGGSHSVKGGATFEANGYSKKAHTVTTEDHFQEISRHELTVQFINTESEEVLVEEASRIQQQVEEAHQREIEELRRKLAEKESEGQTTRRAVLTGHAAQANTLF